ncbi:MAG: response regulator [Bacteroidota bacterium]
MKLGPKILIVDDEEDILELLTYNFESEGYQVLQALDGEQAIELARSEPPDLILLDIMMPTMDGLEACKILRSFPELDHTIIVFLTAQSEVYSEKAGLEAGASAYIYKPIKPSLLKQEIRELLGIDE